MFAFFFFLIKTKRALQAAVTKITLTMEGRVDPYLNYLNSWLKELTPAISIWYSNILIQDIIKKKYFFFKTHIWLRRTNGAQSIRERGNKTAKISYLPISRFHTRKK